MNSPNRTKHRSTEFHSVFHFLKKLFSFGITKDISEIQNKTGHDSFFDLFYQSLAPMLLVEPKANGNHTIVDANKAAELFYGYTRTKFLKLHIGDINIKSQEDRKQLMKKALKSSSSIFQFTHKLANKELKEVQIFSSPILVDEQKLMFLIIQDITDQNKVIQEITEQQAYAQMLFNQSPDSLFIFDVKGTIIDGNRNTELLVGTKKENLIGKNFFETNLLSDSDKKHLKERLEKIINGEPSELLEYTLNRQDGRQIPIEGKTEFIKYKGANYLLGSFHDITTRKQQELKLKESEAKYRYLADFASEWEFWISPEGNYIYISPICEQITGYPSTEFEKNPNLLIELAHPNFKEMLQVHFVVENQSATSHKFEFQIIKPDGELVWIEHSCQPIFDTEKKYLGKRGINRDITKEKNALQSLEESNERFKKLSQLTFEGILILKQNIVQDVNQAFQSLTGFNKTELIGQDFSSVIQTKKIEESEIENADKFYAHFSETIFTKKDGKEIFVEIESKNYTFDGEPIHVVAMRDITKKKKQELRQSVILTITKAVVEDIKFEKLLQIIQNEIDKLMDARNFYFAFYDKDSENISVSFFSNDFDQETIFPAKGSLTGYLIEQKKSLLISLNDLEELRRLEKVQGVGKDAFLWLGVPLTRNDEVVGAFVVQSYTDENAYTKEDQTLLEIIASQISLALERKHNEEALRKALIRAQESDRLKFTFLATMSHELRTPLNAIIGFSDLVESNRPIDEIINFCQIINKSGIHLLGIVNEIFDFTLIETGEIKLIYGEHNLKEIISDVYQIIEKEQFSLKKEHISFTYHIPPKANELIIKTDKQRLQQILINLLKNAFKFTDSGSIKFGFNLIKDNEKAVIQFYVEDTGIGIAKDKEKIIFDVFRQADDSNVRKHDGVGLGLSISKKITELLGGELWLKSKLGVGSTFFFNLPCPFLMEGQEDVFEKFDLIPNYDHKNQTILIAEDDSTNYSLLEFMMEPYNVNLLWARNGKEALDIFNSNPNINLIMVDIRMPKLNGIEVTKFVKKMNPHLPVIVHTAYSNSVDKELALRAGCDEYITKPFQKSDLIRLIKKYLE